jgi:hypothetical protein
LLFWNGPKAIPSDPSSISKADICLPVIGQDDHPGGFRICRCDPLDQDEKDKLHKLSGLIDTMNGESDSTHDSVTTQDLKRVVQNTPADHLNWTNNYTLPWVTLFRSFPWTRRTGLTTSISELFSECLWFWFLWRKRC